MQGGPRPPQPIGATLFSFPQIGQLPPGDVESTCKCRNSRCLKLYCVCFAAQRFCDGCSCIDCGNTEDNINEVNKRRHKVNVKNPHAFQDKKNPIVAKGCNCLKSRCLKGYCECFAAQRPCMAICCCKDCDNMYGARTGPDMAQLQAVYYPHTLGMSTARLPHPPLPRSSRDRPAMFGDISEHPAPITLQRSGSTGSAAMPIRAAAHSAGEQPEFCGGLMDLAKAAEQVEAGMGPDGQAQAKVFASARPLERSTAFDKPLSSSPPGQSLPPTVRTASHTGDRLELDPSCALATVQSNEMGGVSMFCGDGADLHGAGADLGNALPVENADVLGQSKATAGQSSRSHGHPSIRGQDARKSSQDPSAAPVITVDLADGSQAMLQRDAGAAVPFRSSVSCLLPTSHASCLPDSAKLQGPIKTLCDAIAKRDRSEEGSQGCVGAVSHLVARSNDDDTAMRDSGANVVAAASSLDVSPKQSPESEHTQIRAVEQPHTIIDSRQSEQQHLASLKPSVLPCLHEQELVSRTALAKTAMPGIGGLDALLPEAPGMPPPPCVATVPTSQQTLMSASGEALPPSASQAGLHPILGLDIAPLRDVDHGSALEIPGAMAVGSHQSASATYHESSFIEHATASGQCVAWLVSPNLTANEPANETQRTASYSSLPVMVHRNDGKTSSGSMLLVPSHDAWAGQEDALVCPIRVQPVALSAQGLQVLLESRQEASFPLPRHRAQGGTMFYQDGPPLPASDTGLAVLDGPAAGSCMQRSSESFSFASAQQDVVEGALGAPDRKYRSARLRKRAEREGPILTHVAHEGDTPAQVLGKRFREDSTGPAHDCSGVLDSLLGHEVKVPRRVRTGVQPRSDVSGSPHALQSTGEHVAHAQKPARDCAGMQLYDKGHEEVAVLGLLSLAECKG